LLGATTLRGKKREKTRTGAVGRKGDWKSDPAENRNRKNPDFRVSIQRAGVQGDAAPRLEKNLAVKNNLARRWDVSIMWNKRR